VQTVTGTVTADPETCWDLFTDVARMTSWVPGLREAQIITGTRVLPTEIHFEFVGAQSTASYTLVYSYDRTRREVRWEPKLGRQHGVTGFVRFDGHGSGTLVTYGIAHGDARSPADRATGDVQRLLDAFVTRVQAAP
jgi:uncharacterized protein YndB with AHSA1/START domain